MRDLMCASVAAMSRYSAAMSRSRSLHQVDVLQVALGDERDGDVEDVELVLLDEVQQEVEGALELAAAVELRNGEASRSGSMAVTASAGVKARVRGLQVLGGDVGVDLRGGDVRVAEHGLHGAQVGAALQQVRGEGVPELVRRDGLGRSPRRGRSGRGASRSPGGSCTAALGEEECGLDARVDQVAHGRGGSASRGPRATSPKGTRRRLSPLPKAETTPWSRSMSASLRLTSSETRSPEA
jgi:hypothetical protein